VTPLQMAHAAAEALADGGPTAGVVLDVLKGGLPRSFPRGELLNERRQGRDVRRTYSFDPQRVIAWLLANGLVEAEKTGERTMIFREPSEQSEPPNYSVNAPATRGPQEKR
jgi:hypothetical protein